MKGLEDPLVGTVVGGRYRLESRIGVGGMAVVYRATQRGVDRPVAVKVLNEKASNNQNVSERFATEAKVISRLRHPNTVKLHDVGRTDAGRLFIVMELVEGYPLHVLSKKGGVTPMRAVRIMRQVAESLAEAHEAGIVHRDLKPANLLVERVGRQDVAKVLDFGIVKVMDGPSRTVVGAVFGTPAYMSPEQAQGLPVDARADIYGLGIILYEVLSKALPFEHPSVPKMLDLQINQVAPPMTNAADLPADLVNLVSQMIKKRPEDRPQTMDEVHGRLRSLEVAMEREAAFADEAPTRYVTMEPPVMRTTAPPPQRKSRRSSLLIAVVMGLLVGGAAVALAILLDR